MIPARFLKDTAVFADAKLLRAVIGAFADELAIRLSAQPRWIQFCIGGDASGRRLRNSFAPSDGFVWSLDGAAMGEPVLPGRESRHPTEKLLQFFTTRILLHTKKGDICYEPFSGSWTCLCAAETTGRRCFAMELEPEFVAVGLERLAEMGLEPKLANH